MRQPRLVLPVLVFALLSVPARNAWAAEKAIGTSCNSDNSNIDWDAIGQCNGTTFQKGPLILGAMTNPPYAVTTCTSSNAGMLQWTGTAFQGCNGTTWGVIGTGSSTNILGLTASTNSPYATGDTNTGLFSGTASTVSVATAGVERLRVNANGAMKLGAGAVGTGAWLDLSAGTGQSFSSMILPQDTTTNRPSSSSAGMIRYNISTHAVEAYQGSTLAWTALGGGASSTVYLGSATNATNPQNTTDALTGLVSLAASTVGIVTAGTERLRVTATGSVGIGTTAPAQALDVNGNINVSAITSGYYIANAKILSEPASDTTSLAVGPGALAAQTGVGMDNVAIGAQALNACNDSYCSQNVAVGYQAMLNSNHSATSDNAVGSWALASNVTGDGNNAVGEAALSNNVTGSWNTGMGDAALNQSTANNNTALGAEAGNYITSGASNTAVGHSTIAGGWQNPITGNNNTALGDTALGFLQGTASANTAIGQDAGSTISTGTNNTVLGQGVASTYLATGTGNILIGTDYTTDVPSSNTGTSNFLNIGNVIFATGMTGTVAAPAGNVGIGTASPGSPLEVLGATGTFGSGGPLVDISSLSGEGAGVGGVLGFSGNDGVATDRGFAMIGGLKENGTSGNYAGYLAFATRPNGGSLAEHMRITSTGNVGIGTATPANTLDIGNGGGIHITSGVPGQSGNPGTTTNALYNNGGALMWNGSAVGGGASTPANFGGVSSVTVGTTPIQATSAGIVTAYATETGANACALNGYVSSSSSGLIAAGNIVEESSVKTAIITAITFPVPNTDWYAVTATGTGCSAVAYFTPLSGSGGSGGSLSGGTANYMAKWSSSSALTSGLLYDTGSKVLIGTTTPDADSAVFQVITTNDAIWGHASSIGSNGVIGLGDGTSGQASGGWFVATATTTTTGPTYGVYGETDSTYTGANVTDNTSGVYGISTATSGSGMGVYGQSNTNTDSWVGGVVGYYGGSGPDAGVFGMTDSAATGAQGVAGISTTTTNSETIGVYGAANNPSGAGVVGQGISGATGGFFTSDTGIALATGTGYVGIGTLTPANALEISVNNSSVSLPNVELVNANSAGKAQFQAKNDAGTTMDMGVFGSAFGLGLANVSDLGGSAGLVLMSDGGMDHGGTDPIAFRVGGYNSTQEMMRITGTGSVGIGTTTPKSTLSVNGGAAIGTYAGTATAPSNGLIVSGQVGIGTTTASLHTGASLDMSGHSDSLLLPTGTTGQEPGSPQGGMIRYNSTTGCIEGYEGSSAAWTSLSCGATAAAFNFTNQTGVSPSSTIYSNAVTLSGFTGALSATCGTGCAGITRNCSSGASCSWSSPTLAGFNAGDTIAIKQTSAAGANAPSNATVTVGTTTSGTWTVTTNNNTANAFSFTDQPGVGGNIAIISNAVTLLGFTGTLTATCNTGCLGIMHNNTWFGTVATGFAANDTIAIKLISSSTNGGTATASVTVGGTVSGTWTVTTGADACPTVSTLGGVCPNGLIYAGTAGDTGAKMYTTPCDANAYGNQGSCTACTTGLWSGSGTTCNTTWSAGPGIAWNNGSSNWTWTYVQSTTAGKTNTTTLVGISDLGAPYKAANYCATLNAYGYNDWYLPAQGELAELYANLAVIGGFNTSPTGTASDYWSSTEYTNLNYFAYGQQFSSGSQYNSSKSNGFLVRCVRR